MAAHWAIGRPLVDTLSDTLAKVKAEAHFDTLAETIAHVEAKTLGDSLGHGETKALDVILPGTLADEKAKQFLPHWATWRSRHWSKHWLTRYQGTQDSW